MKYITQDIINIGVSDFEVDLFEGQYSLPNGIAYNSYVVLDEQITIFDSVDNRFSKQWLDGIEKATGGKAPDYLVIQHMEPDHSGSLHDFIKKYPSTKIVANSKTFTMIDRFFCIDCQLDTFVVSDGQTLCTGKHSFTFVFAPMVHWPEVMVSYDSYSKVLFSADAFGTFGVYEENQQFTASEWAEEASRYYIGIVGKYGAQVQALLKKASALDISVICSLHGPALRENLPDYFALYDTWSSYTAEKQGVCIVYSSAYGNTQAAAKLLYDKLSEKGCDVLIYDLARCDKARAIADVFRYDRTVFASITYNMSISPYMHSFINGLVERNFQNKKVAFIENGSWAPAAQKVMKGMLEKCKDITYLENSVTVKSALEQSSLEAIEKLVAELTQ